jgi:sugar phosphate isomerase/epimerase
MSPAPDPGFGDRDSVRRTADLVNRANDLARARELTLGYHNHYWELAPLDDGRPALLHFYEHLAPDVVAEVDIYWAQVGGSDPAEIVDALGPRAQLLHVKDGPGDDRAAANVAVGDGAVDTKRVLAAATAARWHLVEFDRCDTDMFDAVERSYGFLVGNGLSRGRA